MKVRFGKLQKFIFFLNFLLIQNKFINFAGDWDAAEIYEVFPSIEINATAYIHPNFTANNLKNNIAIIRLASPAPLGQYPTISNICLPSEFTSLTN